MRRRNLSSSQWAAIAVEAEEILAAIAVAVESERRTKISEARQAETTQLIEPSPEKNERSSHAKAPEPITQLIVEQPREKREAVGQEQRKKQSENAANRYTNKDTLASVNKLTEPKKEDTTARATHKAAELVLTSRKTGWLTIRTFASFSPCTRPTTLHVVFDIF